MRSFWKETGGGIKMEETVFEGKFYYQYVGGEEAEVEVTPTRFIFKIGNNWIESILIYHT